MQVSWRGLALGQGTPYRIQKVNGWESRPATRRDDDARASSHGVHAGPLYADERIVMIEGVLVDRAAAAALVLALEAATPLVSTVHDLTVTTLGRTLRAGARCIDRDLPMDLGYNIGRFDWMLQFACPDPKRYGASQSPSTALPLAGGGLVYPLAYPLAYGDAGVTGRVTVTNAGGAPAPLLIAVRGGLPQGWIVSAGDRVLAYPAEVPSGQTVVVNSADGTVLVEGTASRRGNLTRADWLVCPAADPVTGAPGTLDVQFASLGGERDPDALMTVTCVDTYW